MMIRTMSKEIIQQFGGNEKSEILVYSNYPPTSNDKLCKYSAQIYFHLRKKNTKSKIVKVISNRSISRFAT